MAHKENLADKNFSNNLISATLTDWVIYAM